MSAYRKFCLLGSSLGTNNFGVNVLTVGTAQCLLEAYPQAEISILDYGREPNSWELKFGERTIEVALWNIRFSKKFWQHNHIAYLILQAAVARCIPFSGLRERFLSGNPILKHLREMDVITAISGGDSFSDIYGLERFFYVSLPQILIILLNKRLILLPQTYGPFTSSIAKSVSRFIIRNSDRAYSRDLKGVADVEKLLGTAVGRGKVRFSHDVGFVVDPIRPADYPLLSGLSTFKQKGPVVGLNVSGLLFKGGYNQDNAFGLKFSYPEFTRSVINFFLQDRNVTLLLIPHVFGTSNFESDVAVSESLYNELVAEYGDRLQVVRQGLDEREIKYVIGQCDFFVGARMHACIAALSQCVPSVPIAYSDKFIGVMRTIGAETLVADPRYCTAQEILAQVRSIYENRQAIRSRLEAVVPKAKTSALNLFKDIADNTFGYSAAPDVTPLSSNEPPKLAEPAEPLRR
jgi:colanic acid/amylovoran biosynthesis protein